MFRQLSDIRIACLGLIHKRGIQQEMLMDDVSDKPCSDTHSTMERRWLALLTSVAVNDVPMHHLLLSSESYNLPLLQDKKRPLKRMA